MNPWKTLYYIYVLLLEMITLLLVLFLLLGKGPLRAYYEDLIKKKQLQKVSICTMWLSFEDYPALLGKYRISDLRLGVSLIWLEDMGWLWVVWWCDYCVNEVVNFFLMSQLLSFLLKIEDYLIHYCVVMTTITCNCGVKICTHMMK